MPLEATILCLDTSGWMANGDYTPTRIDAQYDAATMLCGAKIDSNPESTVGVLTAGGKGCVWDEVCRSAPVAREEVVSAVVRARRHWAPCSLLPTRSVSLLTSPTEDLGKLLACLHGLHAVGASQFVSGVKTAMVRGGQRVMRGLSSRAACRDRGVRASLVARDSIGQTLPPSTTAQIALKHRKNKHGSQRIVAFVGSPLGAGAPEEELKKLGAALKKSNVRAATVWDWLWRRRSRHSGASCQRSHSRRHAIAVVPCTPQIAIDVISMGEQDSNDAKLRVRCGGAPGEAQRCLLRGHKGGAIVHSEGSR